MKINFKKIYNSKTAIIAGVILFALIVPNFAHANIGILIARGIVSIFFTLFGYLVGMGAWFFEQMLKIGFSNQKAVVEIGWKVIRDFSNMFFILVMVVIAFATILRLERYGIKELLPKVIIIALLINFSLIICYIIIDFSDITATYFINEAKNGAGQNSSIAATLQDGLNITQMYAPVDCDKIYNQFMEECNGMTDLNQKQICSDQAASGKANCLEAQKNQGTAISNGTNVLVATIVGTICLLVAAFTLFAGGILLIVRLMFLWFLVMLAPIVYLCYLMPGLRSNWQKWWRSFIGWCLFAPIYSFFIWLAVKISAEYKLAGVKMLSDPVPSAAFAGASFLRSGNYIIGFLFLIAILLGGLIAAKNLSLYGAETALKIGQKWYGGAKNWAKQTAMKPAKGVAERAGAGFQQVRGGVTAWVGRGLPGKIGRRMEARGAEIKQRAAETAYNKKYENLLKTMAGDNVLKEVETATGARKLIATREASRRGLLREAKPEQVTKAIGAMKVYGATDIARSLEELRPDAIEKKEERADAIERAIASGTHKKWSKEVFKEPRGSEIASQLQEQLGTTEFANVFKSWAQDIKNAAETAMKVGFTDNFTTPAPGKKNENIERRKAFAKATGKANEAFFTDAAGNPVYEGTPAAEKQAEDYIKSLNDEGISKLYFKDAKNKTLLARHLTTSQVEGAGAKLSGQDKRDIMDQIRKFAEKDAERQKVLEQMERSLGWGGGAPAKTVDLSAKRPKKPGQGPIDTDTGQENFEYYRDQYPPDAFGKPPKKT